MKDKSKSNLTKLVEELSALGEDHKELQVWLNFFDLMNEAEQTKLLDNLTKELKALKQLK